MIELRKCEIETVEQSFASYSNFLRKKSGGEQLLYELGNEAFVEKRGEKQEKERTLLKERIVSKKKRKVGVERHRSD